MNILQVPQKRATRRIFQPAKVGLQISNPQPLRQFLGMGPMDTEMIADLLDAETLRPLHGREIEEQLRQRRCDETQLHEPVDTFPGLDLGRIKTKVLFRIAKCGLDLPSVVIVLNDLGDPQGHICDTGTVLSVSDACGSQRDERSQDTFSFARLLKQLDRISVGWTSLYTVCVGSSDGLHISSDIRAWDVGD